METQLITARLPLPFGTRRAFTTTTNGPSSSTCKVSFSRRWESNPNGHVGFNPNLYDDGDGDGDDDDNDNEFLFGGRANQRVWWFEGDDNDDDYDDDDDDEEFWGFKVFRAFGWMLPAIGVSLLLGTGPNAFLMALIPLGQTALSLAFDKLLGSTTSGPKPRRKAKTKRKPFVRSANGFRKDEVKQENIEVDNNGNYSSWEVAGNSTKMGNQRGPKFGGWDELDRREWTNRKASRKMADLQLGLHKNGRLRRRRESPLFVRLLIRRRESPLFVRLLIAVFPFLGSWTRFFF